jgi:reverse gyrase
MAIFVCGPNEIDIFAKDCWNCGGNIDDEVEGGFSDVTGKYCSEDCVAEAQLYAAEQARVRHLRLRDLMCACEDFCAPAGLPSEQDRAEYAAYVGG